MAGVLPSFSKFDIISTVTSNSSNENETLLLVCKKYFILLEKHHLCGTKGNHLWLLILLVRLSMRSLLQWFEYTQKRLEATLFFIAHTLLDILICNNKETQLKVCNNNNNLLIVLHNRVKQMCALAPNWCSSLCHLIGIIEYLLPKESIMSEPNKAKMADISLHFKMLVKLVSFCKCCNQVLWLLREVY